MRLIGLVLACMLLNACGSSTGDTAEDDRIAVVEPDGSHSFYAGRGVGKVITSGGTVGEDYPVGFMALNVPAWLYAEAEQAPSKVKTVSLEVPDPSIEIVVHFLRPGSDVLETLYFHPGDPWVTGYAQVGAASADFMMGYFEAIKWNRDTGGTMPSVFSQEIHTTGLLPDDDKPPLKYAEDPTKEPLPPNWI